MHYTSFFFIVANKINDKGTVSYMNFSFRALVQIYIYIFKSVYMYMYVYVIGCHSSNVSRLESEIRL